MLLHQLVELNDGHHEDQLDDGWIPDDLPELFLQYDTQHFHDNLTLNFLMANH